MMPEDKNTPSVRFAGFTDAWEQCKFSDFVQTRRGLTYSPANIRTTGVRVLRSSNIAEDQFVYGADDVFVDANAVNIPYAQQGDILITSANGSTRLVGKHAIIKTLPNNSAVHGGFMLLASARNPEFVNALISAPWYSRFISLYVAGGNGAIGNLNKNDLDEQLVLIPKEKEQKLIGFYFREIDRLITLHRRKLEKLQNIKKACLEKMFPKKGELVPEVRFAGFTGEWERRKIGDLSHRTTGGGTPRTEVEEYWSGKIPWFQSSDFKDGIVTLTSSNKHISQEGLQNSAAQLIQGQSIAIVVRVGFGKLALIPFQYATSQDVLSLSNLTVDPLFGVYSIYKKLKSELMAVQGTSIKGITKDDLLSKNIAVSTNRTEQRKIGSLLCSIDALITHHQRKLEKLQNIKKACLEKMFV